MRKITPIPPFYEYETDFSKFEINSKHRHSFGAGISIGIIM